MLSALLRVIRPYPWWPPVLLLLGVLASLAEGIGITLLIPLFQGLAGRLDGVDLPLVGSLDGLLAGFSPHGRSVVLALAVVGLTAGKALIVYANTSLYCRVYGRVAKQFQDDSFDRVLRMDFAQAMARGQGRLFNTVTAETWRASDALTALFNLAVSGSTVLVFTLLLLSISWHLTLAVLAGAVLIALLVRLLVNRMRTLGKFAYEAQRRLTELCMEALDRQRLIRAFGQEEREVRRFAEATEAVRRRQLAVQHASAVIQPVQEMLHVPVFVGALMAAPLVGVTAAALVAFLLLLYRMQPHLKALDHLRLQLGALGASMDDVRELLDRTPPAGGGDRPFPGLSRSIVFSGVGFRYPARSPDEEAPPVLHDVSFEMAKGSVTAVVGVSGAGKSTLVHLLMRLYEPTEGAILADGVPLAAIRLSEWRKAVAVAGQDFELASGTVAENIAYGSPGAAREDIEAAARRVGADGFIRALPQGYETAVGDRGYRLSGGQRQRIGLARAVLSKRPVLILDEPTSALDSEADAVVRDAISALRSDHTILVIAHRLSTVRTADQFVVIEAGRVAERGSWQELIHAGRTFATFHRLQSIG